MALAWLSSPNSFLQWPGIKIIAQKQNSRDKYPCKLNAIKFWLLGGQLARIHSRMHSGVDPNQKFNNSLLSIPVSSELEIIIWPAPNRAGDIRKPFPVCFSFSSNYKFPPPIFSVTWRKVEYRRFLISPSRSGGQISVMPSRLPWWGLLSGAWNFLWGAT